jgi:hypothetical protein
MIAHFVAVFGEIIGKPFEQPALIWGVAPLWPLSASRSGLFSSGNNPDSALHPRRVEYIKTVVAVRPFYPVQVAAGHPRLDPFGPESSVEQNDPQRAIS